MLEILEFKIPEFTRFGWVSPRAESMWCERLKRVKAAWQEVEVSSVAEGVREACILRTSREEASFKASELHRKGLVVQDLDSTGGFLSEISAVHNVRYLVYRSINTMRVSEILSTKDPQTFGILLCCPECCNESYYERIKKLGIKDVCVGVALASHKAGRSPVMVFSPPFQTNVFWRSIGVMAVPHQPCSSECTLSIELSHSLIDLGIQLGYTDEMEWLECMLEWPLNWSCLHGIAELVTPVFRAESATDATSTKLTIRCTGRQYPTEGASGPYFPFQGTDFSK